MPRKPKTPLTKVQVLMASGASGGHLFPALAVAEALRAEGHGVTMVLGGHKFAELVTATELPLVQLPAAAFNDRGVLRLAWACFRLLQGVWQAWWLLKRLRPQVVFGTGGYATVAVVLAARAWRIPVVIHEQNVLPGRANTFLARLATKVVLTFVESQPYFSTRLLPKLVLGGMPLRRAIVEAAANVAPKPASNVLTLLVLGGSQGARILAEVVPEAIRMLSPDERAHLRVVQQARPEEVERVQETYASLEAPLASFEVAPFFHDLPSRYATADVLVGRSGVGTLLEAALFGLPAVYVPLEIADGHQKLNAAVAEQAGAAVVLAQAYFTPANLLVQLRSLWQDERRRAAMAKAARGLLKPDAARTVAEIVVGAGGRTWMKEERG